MEKNLIDQYIKICSQCTDAPDVFHKFSGLTIAGVCLSRCWLAYGDGRLYPNLWTLLIAPSSSYRKSTCTRLGRKLLNVAAPGHWFPTWCSPEAFLVRLQQCAIGAFVIDEYKKFDENLQKEYMREMRGILTDAYDTPSKETYYRYTLSRKPVELKERPVISLLAATTLDWLDISEESIFGGYLPRFLIVPVMAPKDKYWPFPPPINEGTFNTVAGRFNELCNAQQEMHLASYAMDLHKENYEAFIKKTGNKGRWNRPILDPFVHRLMTTVLKLAMIYQACTPYGGYTIDLEAMEAAWRDIRQIYSWLLEVEETQFAYSLGEKTQKKILTLIRNAGKEGVMRSILLKNGHVSKWELDNILRTLFAANLVTHDGKSLVATQEEEQES